MPQPYHLTNEAIEQALLTGEHAGLLEDYFGTENYAELQQLAHDAAAQRVRGGPRTLILPGIMGSTIGKKRFGPFDDILWFDPIDIFNGRLDALALDWESGRPGRHRGRLARGQAARRDASPGGQDARTPTTRYKALGVLEFTYLRLKLSLIRDGYDADYHPYDWRFSIETAARDLLQRLAKENAVLVNLVAHSMGGLVARTALGIGKREGHAGHKKIRRLIMLGTPNFGSFAPVQVIRGTYDTVRKVAQLDRKHDATWLAGNVFNTFPGLYEMLPAPEKFAGIDVYKTSAWPPSGPTPRQPLLDRVSKTRKLFAPGNDKMFLIAGVNLNTTVGARSGANEFLYEVSREGDGTVPLDFALLPGTKTYYIEEVHGSLPNNPRVARAAAEILDRGETEVLPDEWARTRAVPRTVPESELRVSPFDEARPLSQRETRHLIDEFAAPDSTEDGGQRTEDRPALAIRPPSSVLSPPLIVGRRKQHRVDLRLALGSITEVDSRAYVLGLFKDVTPGGAARALDERLDGAITELSLRRMFSGGVGEIFMMPASRSGLRTEVIAFVGLGSFDRFSEEIQELAAENVIRTFVRINVEELATVLVGAGSGAGIERSLRALLGGFVRGLIDADVDHRFRRLVICEREPEKFQEIKEHLFRLASTELFSEVEITFDEITLPPSPAVAAVTRQPLVTGGAQPVYLIAQVERESERSMVLRSSVLTAGSKATVVTGTQTFSTARLARILSPISNSRFTRESLRAIGTELGTSLLDDTVRTVLGTTREHHLVVVHDAEASRVPWEVLCVDGWFPAAEAGLSHRYAAENLSVAKWLEERREDETLQILLIVNPTEDLEGAEEEGERLRSLFVGEANVRIDEYRGHDATKPALLSAFRSGKYDVVHYAGHAFFDAANPASSGLLCHGGAVLSGADLAGLGDLPALVFFNACESGRVRAAKKATRVNLAKRVVESVGVAEAFLRGGVANYLGTYWPVGDAAAEKFASTFYERLLEGESIGTALQNGREDVRKLGRQSGRDWADYVLYGNPQFVLKKR